ncbi:MAG: phosphoglucosamine mutase [Bacteroidia bacterium]
MALISSISGTRGTIGGAAGKNLTPIDVVKFASAYGMWLLTKRDNNKVVIGRDARPSGEMVHSLVANTLVALGFHVIDLGLSTTPTVEMAVTDHKAAGGIILTASHNPVEWNALKLLNYKGEFVTRKDGDEILNILKKEQYRFSQVQHLGKIEQVSNALDKHIFKILALPLVDAYSVGKVGLKIVVDGVNSSGSFAVPRLLEAMGINDIIVLNAEPTGWFAHNPEPLKQNLTEICEVVKREKADLGIVVDPDVDRLVLIDENGEMVSEEYTLVAIADYILQRHKSPVVSNLSSSRALKDVAERHGCRYYASAVGEVNVTEIMKRHDALIGGEGNGGIIYPELHYGRDALVGIALFLSHLTKSGKTCSALRATYPDYFMSKQKIELKESTNVSTLFDAFKAQNQGEKFNDVDGLKIDYANSWVHLRTSNTEPIMRIYTEAKTQAEADELANKVKETLMKLV